MLQQELISVHDSSRWDDILSGLPHAPAHTASYNLAMMKSSKRQTFLYVARSDNFIAVCPVAKRFKYETIDLVTPYGFGGFIAQGDYRHFEADFDRFMRQQQILSSYLAVHPVFCQSESVLSMCEKVSSAVYTLNLRKELPDLFSQLHKSQRYEIRKMQTAEVSILGSSDEAIEHLILLYRETLSRTQAAGVYYFDKQTLADILKSKLCLALAAKKDGKIVAITMVIYNRHISDYFINASNDEGRDYTRVLLWKAIEHLHHLGVDSLNLGGGVKPNDNLEQFKGRFSSERIEPYVLKRIYNENVYHAVCARANVDVSKTNYFPAYHANSS